MRSSRTPAPRPTRRHRRRPRSPAQTRSCTCSASRSRSDGPTSRRRRFASPGVRSTPALVEGLLALAPDQRPRTLVSQSSVALLRPARRREARRGRAGRERLLAGVVATAEHEALAAASSAFASWSRAPAWSVSSAGARHVLPFFRLGIGGPVAGGRQYVPWVHLDDVVGAMLFCAGQARGDLAGRPDRAQPGDRRRALEGPRARVEAAGVLLPVPGLAVKSLYGEMAGS